MADVIKDIYVESKNYRKVIFQHGRDVCDFELNELQDIMQGMLSRYWKTTYGNMCYANSWKVVGTGETNAVTIKSGVLFKNGKFIVNSNDFTFNVPEPPPSGTRTDRVYLKITQVEITSDEDPEIIEGDNIFGETALRDKISVEVLVSQGGGVPTDSGGIEYFELAFILRTSGQDLVSEAIVTDTRATGVKPNVVVSASEPAMKNANDFWYEEI